ncbi:short chain dehydrogenase [Aureococcus anophagefferens]|uniref:Short chain dehydrogenase n=1 Tax=Aureococcus anophagefferens TaxID=44056 RepID=A0ABR1GFM8_AURAN
MGNRRRKKPTTPSKLGTPSPSSKKPAITLDDPARGPVDDSDEGLLPRLAAAVFGVVAAVASLVAAAATLVGAAPASALRADFEEAAAEEATRQPRSGACGARTRRRRPATNTEELKLQKDRWRERLETLERSEVYNRARADETRELVAAEEATSDLISDTDRDDVEGDDDAEGDMDVGGDSPSTGPGPEGVDTIAGKVFQATGFGPAARDELRRACSRTRARASRGDKLKIATYGLIATKRLKKNPGSNMKMHDAMHKGKPVFTMSEIKEFEDVTIEEMALDVDKEYQGSAPWKAKAMPTVRLSKAQAEAFVGPKKKMPDGLKTSEAEEKGMKFCDCLETSCPHLHRCKCADCGRRYFSRRGKRVDGPSGTGRRAGRLGRPTELAQHGPPATLLTDAGHAHEFALDVEELTLDEVDLYAFSDDKNLKPLNRARRRVLTRKSGPYHVGVRLIPVLNGELPTVDGHRRTMTMADGRRVAIVTGATRGIGKGIALELGRAGYAVHAVGRSSRSDPDRDVSAEMGEYRRLPADEELTVERTAEQLKKHGVATTALYPGLVRTEANLEMVDMGTWGEGERRPDLARRRDAAFSGRGLVALLGLPQADLLARSGNVEVIAELADEFGFDDVEKEAGKPVPAWIRDNVPDVLLPWSVFFSAGPPPEPAD